MRHLDCDASFCLLFFLNGTDGAVRIFCSIPVITYLFMSKQQLVYSMLHQTNAGGTLNVMSSNTRDVSKNNRKYRNVTVY